MIEPETGALLRVPLGDGTVAMVQVVAVEPRAVAVSVADVIWDCEPGLLDWQSCGRALVHLALRPTGLSGAAVAGHADVDPAALAAHARWRAAPDVTPAPLAAIVKALLAP